MYITNPTSEMLNKWYKTDAKMGQYLIEKKHFPVIHIDNNRNYYFVKNAELNFALNEAPFWLKFKKIFKGGERIWK